MTTYSSPLEIINTLKITELVDEVELFYIQGQHFYYVNHMGKKINLNNFYFPNREHRLHLPTARQCHVWLHCRILRAQMEHDPCKRALSTGVDHVLRLQLCRHALCDQRDTRNRHRVHGGSHHDLCR